MSGGQQRLASVAVLAAALVVTFSEALGRGRVFFQRDILSYWYPGMEAFRTAIADGSWPLWSPHVGFGAPLLADASFQLAYPPTWLALVLPLDRQYALFVIGHCLFAAAGAFYLVRLAGLGRPAAAAGAIGYAFSGPFLSAASLFHHYAGAAFLPWVLAALVRLLRRPGPLAAAWLGAAAGGQLLAGSGDLCLLTGVSGSVLALALLLARPRGRRVEARLLAWGGVAALLAAGLGAAQWLPTAERAAEGARPAGAMTVGYWSLHPASLVDLAVPRLLSDAPLTAAARAALFEGRAPLLACVYLGLGVLALGALALRASPLARLAAGAGLFWVVASLGRHSLLTRALLWLPGFSLMRYPQKFLLAAALCFAVAAAAGVEQLLASWDAPGRRWASRLALSLVGFSALALIAAAAAASGRALPAAWVEPAAAVAGDAAAALRLSRSAGILAALGALLFWRAQAERPRFAAAACLLSVAAADLVTIARTVNPLAPAELVSRQPALVAALRPLAGVGRVLFVSKEPACARVRSGPPGWSEEARGALAALESLQPPAGARWGYDGSFDGQFTGLEPRWSLPLIAAAAELSGSAVGTQLLQLGNVGRVLFLGREPLPGLEPLGRVETGHACPLQLLAVPQPLPRAYVAARARPLPSTADAWAAVLAPGFDPRREVLLGPSAPGSASPRGDGSAVAGDARVVWRRSDALEVEASLTSSGVLVLVEAFDAGWIARVDGAPAEVLRANVLFRGVRLAPGRHRVRFDYRPRSAVLGAGLALSSLVALSGLVLLGSLGSRLKRGQADDSIRPARKETA